MRWQGWPAPSVTLVRKGGYGPLASEAVAAVPLSNAASARRHLRWPASVLQDETGGGNVGVTVNIFEQATTWLQRLDMWLNANKLQLNVSKTKYLLFKSKGTNTTSHPQLQFQNVNI